MGDGRLDARGNGFERRTTSSPVSTPRTPSSASAAVGSTVTLAGELRADDRRMPGVRDGLEVVDEPPLAAKERLVLDALERAPDPRGVLRGDGHGRSIARRRWLPARDPQPRGGELLVRRAAPSSARNASMTARGLRA